MRLQQSKTKVIKTRFDEESWEGVDRGLFESLRALRRQVADERDVPPYVLFNDATLRDMSRVRPGSPASLLNVRGVGERKLADIGQRFLEAIADYCRSNGLALDASIGGPPRRVRSGKSNDTKSAAFEMFAKGSSVEQAAASTGRAISTIWTYLVEFIHMNPSQRLDPWVDQETYRAIAEVAADLGTAYLKPIFEQLGGKVPYEHIRVAVAHIVTTTRKSVGI